MTATLTRTQTVSKASPSGLMIDGKFTGASRWADLNLEELEWKCVKPEWFDQAVEELRWARDCGERYSAIMFAGVAVIMHPYALTLRDTLYDLEAGVEYDQHLEAWKVPDAPLYADPLRSIFSRYNIAASPRLEDALDGLDKAVEVIRRTSEEAEQTGYEVPTGFASGRELKEHQAEAVLTLAANGGGLLADQVGLGKGGEFVCGLLCLSNYVAKHGGDHPFPVVIAVTKSMKLEIAEEVQKWKHDARIEILVGQKASPISPDTEFIIVNHDLLSHRLDDILDVSPRAFIADEAHVYKNKETKRSKAAVAIAKAVKANSANPYIVMASGTPFLNAPKELWSLLIILGWDKKAFQVAKDAYERKHGTAVVRTRVGREQSYFKKGAGNKGSGKIVWKDVPLWGERAYEIRWCGGEYDQYGAWHNSGATNSAELNKLLLEMGMIRRRKSDVISPLPPLEESLFRFELDEDSKREYDEVSDDFREWLIEVVGREARAAGRNPARAIDHAIRKLMNGEDVMRLTKLRSQLALLKVPNTVEWVHRFMAGDPILPPKKGADLTRSDDEPEMEWDETRRKLILYVHHREARQALLDEPSFAQYNPVHILPGADQKDESIVDHKRRFQEDPDVRLIICTMAAREGHTLTAAKDVYLHEMPFVPSWIVQMAGRCWARMSELYEPHEAYLHYAIAEDTIDSMLVRTNAIKKAMFSSVIDGEGQDDSESDLLFAKPTEKYEDESWEYARRRQSNKLLEAFSIGDRELGIAK